jgi:hypothetical protein
MSKNEPDALSVSIELPDNPQMVVDILTAQFGHLDAGEARTALEACAGTADVWNDESLMAAFEVSHFVPPYVSVIRRSDGVRGTVMFIDAPRLYFSFVPERTDAVAPAAAAAGLPT